MTLTQFLNDRGYKKFEGHCQETPKQVEDLIKLSNGHIDIMEIGFNAGHSAEVFLNNNSIRLTSFDLGYHMYVQMGKEYIDMTYPNRHSLIIGNSNKTIPEYIDNNPKKFFDVIFIDGCHNYEIVNTDLKNCRKLAHKDTIVILDDTVYTDGWTRNYTIGPTKAWTEHLEKGIITELNRIEYKSGVGMSWGKYVF